MNPLLLSLLNKNFEDWQHTVIFQDEGSEMESFDYCFWNFIWMWCKANNYDTNKAKVEVIRYAMQWLLDNDPELKLP